MQCYVSFVKMSVTSMYRVTAIRTFIVNSVSFIGIALKRAIVDRRLLIGIIPLFLILYSLFHFAPSVQADEYQDLQNQINDLQHQLELSKNATTPLEGQVKDLNGQLDAIVSRIAVLQKDLQKSEDELSFKKEVLARTVREFYINSFVDVPLLTLFASNDATDTLKQIALQQQSSKENKNVISEISGKISKLADDKRRLAIAQEQVDRQSQFLKGDRK